MGAVPLALRRDEKLRILQVHCAYRQAGGEDAVVATEATLLRAAGHEVVTRLEHNPEGTAAALGALALAPHNPLAARRVRATVEEVMPDVVHVHNLWFALSPAVVRALEPSGLPVVMTLHNFRTTCANSLLYRDGAPCELCIDGSPWQGVRHACYRGSRLQSVPAAATIALARRRTTWSTSVHAFLALTDFARQRLARAGLPAARMHLKPNAVADPGPRTRPAATSPEVLYVGRLAPEKGVGVLLEGWAAAAPTDLRLVVVGDGPERARLERRGVPGVSFVGPLPQEEVSRRMLEARALLFPSTWYEGQPMVLLEALASGLPIRASNLGGAGETVRDLGPGALVAPGDADAWAAAIRELAGDAASLETESLRARTLWSARHTPEHALANLEAAYATAVRVAGTASSPSPVEEAS